MNLWLRLLALLLTARLRPRADLFDTTSLRMTVWPGDLDLNLHVNNGRYFTMADLGRIDFMLRTGVARIALARRGRPIVGDAMAKFRKGLQPFQRFTLQTRLMGWNEKWFFIEHRFIRANRVAGMVVMRGLFLAPKGPIKPAELVAPFGLPAESPALPDWVLAWSRTCDSMAETLRQEESIAPSTQDAPDTD